MEFGGYRNGTILGIKKSDPILVHPLTDEYPKGFYFLSNLDQNIAVIIKTLYCFKPSPPAANENNKVEVGEIIRKGLEKILVEYYPFAGSLAISSQGKLIVDCGKNDGVPFVEAVAEAKMEILGDISTIPDPAILEELIHTNLLLPAAPKNILQIPLLTVQVTTFKCGGFTVGLALNHCMADGIAAMQFINSWAETTRGLPLKSLPYLDRSILASRHPPIIDFPHEEFMDIDDMSNTNLLYQNEELKYESFKFDLEKIQRLKKLATEDGVIKSCTTFTVLTALVWRSRTRALKMKHSQKTKLLFAVDGRTKLNPPLPKHYFGNGIVIPSCMTSAGELIGKPLSYAVGLVQNTIKMVSDEYIRSSVDYFETTRARPSLTASLLVTSWSRLSFNTTDFGWGEPTQTGCVTLPEKEMALFLSKGKEMGTTVLLGLPITAMKTFQELMQI